MKLRPAQLGRIDLQLARRLARRCARHVGRLGPAGAAIGVDRRGVGEHRLHLGVDRRRRVLAGQQRRVEDGRHRRREGRQVGAHVGDRLDLQRQELAVLVERQLGMGDVVAAVRSRSGTTSLRSAVHLIGRPTLLRRPGSTTSLRRSRRSWSRSRRRRRARSRAPCARAGRARRPTGAAAGRAGSATSTTACSCRCRVSYSAAAARGSIALGISRLLTRSSLVTCAALANAASTSAFSPISQS